MELIEVMRTAFAAREFNDAPVTDEQLLRLLEHARFAPSGGNRQGWQVIVVKNPQLRAQLAELMAPIAQRYMAQTRAGEQPLNTIVPTALTAAQIAATPVPVALLEQLVSAPVLLVVVVDLQVVAAMDSELPRIGVVPGASIYPFVWNILLAARNEGLGGVLTTFLASAEPQVQQLLGLAPHHAVAAMLPIGVPVRQLKRLKRKPVSSFAWIDRLHGEPLVAADERQRTTHSKPHHVKPFEYGRWQMRIEVGPGRQLALFANDCLRKQRIGDGDETLYVWTNLELEWEEHHWIEVRLLPGLGDGSAVLKVTSNGDLLFEEVVAGCGFCSR